MKKISLMLVATAFVFAANAQEGKKDAKVAPAKTEKATPAKADSKSDAKPAKAKHAKTEKAAPADKK